VALVEIGPPRFARVRADHRIPAKPGEWFESRTLSDGTTHLRWADLFEFLIAADGRTIEFARLRRATNESLTTYLLGQVLSFSLLSMGYDPLHATAVVIDGEAVAFLGDCGYGKSTIGAAFVARGVPLLTDDVLALERRSGRWIAHSGPARVKLFPTVAERLLRRGRGRLLNPVTSKLVIPLAPGERVEHDVPLKVLYVLPRPRRRPAGGRPTVRISPMTGQPAFLAITRAAFNLTQVDEARLQNQFTLATRLIRDVPVRQLSYSRTLAGLDTVCEAVIDDADALRTDRRETA
jgi:hypothetical protein